MNLGPRYVPDYRLTLGGEPAPAELRASVTGITHESALEGADQVEIGLVNERLRWLDHDLLRLGQDLTLDLGYADGEIRRVFVGEIVAQGASFPAGGAPTLTITAHDRMHRMQQGVKNRWMGFPIPFLGLYPLNDPVVASIVAVENGLLPVIDPLAAALSAILSVADVAAASTPRDWLKSMRKKQAETDFEFLRRIGRENGWEVLVDHTGPLGGYVLRMFSPAVDAAKAAATQVPEAAGESVVPGQLQGTAELAGQVSGAVGGGALPLPSGRSATVALKYGESLVEFSPRISEVGQANLLRARVPVPEIKTDFLVTVGWDWDRSMLTVSIVPALGPADLLVETFTAADATDEVDEPLTLLSAPRFLISDLIPRLNNRLTASGTAVGDSRIQAGGVLRIEGVGEQFGGLYRVTSAAHSLDSGGFQTRFELRKEIWFGSIPRAEQGAVRIGVDLAFANDIAVEVPFGNVVNEAAARVPFGGIP